MVSLKMYPDIIFSGGAVFTGRRIEEQWEQAECVAVSGERILAVGPAAEVLNLAGPETQIIDLQGRTLMAGFNDAHCHLTEMGTARLGINCKDLYTKEAIQEAVGKKVQEVGEGQWIRGFGYSELVLPEKQHITRWDLDKVSPNNPVMLRRTCFHAAVFNSCALRLLGISDYEQDPPGGEYVRVNDIVSGVCKERAFMNHQDTMAFSVEQIAEGIAFISAGLFQQGVTSVQDMGGVVGNRTLQAFQQAVESKHDIVRICAAIFTLSQDEAFQQGILNSGIYTGFGNDRLHIGPLKVMIDGAGYPNTKMRRPYKGLSGYDGIQAMPTEKVTELIIEAHKRGFSCTAHAIGDRAIEIMLDACAQAQQLYPRPDARHRVEHCNFCAPDLQERMKQLNMIPSVQPVFYHILGDHWLRTYGEELLAYSKPLRSWLDAGLVPAFGTDAPISPTNPFCNVYSAVTRKTGSGVVVPGNEQVTVPESLWMYTYGSARAEGTEAYKGIIAPDYLADLIVLDQNIMEVEIERIPSVKVQLTVLGGKVVYTDGELL